MSAAARARPGRKLLQGVVVMAVALAAAVPTRAGPAAARYPVIAAAGDIACDPSRGAFHHGLGTPAACQQLTTSKLLLRGRYSAVLALGDNQYEDGRYGAYQASYAHSWGQVKRITRPTPGNHDYHTAGAAGYFRYFGRAAGRRGSGYYSYDVGSWHLVSLNSNCSDIGGCETGSAQERWLAKDLAAHPTRCTLAYWHHPRFSSGPHGSDTHVGDLWQTLYQHDADVVLVGHDHLYERFAPLSPGGAVDARRGIREFVVGTGGRSHYDFRSIVRGSQARDATSFGILALTLKPTAYTWRFLPAVGSFTDGGSGRCH